MIYLFTGTPGSSKTLNVLKMVNEDSQFKDRPVYYHRIKELKLPWFELSDEEVRNWESLPDGSVLVVDEAQYLLPTRDPKKPMPDWVTRMSEHRHRGFDMIFITQNPMLLDAGFRRFVGRHIHIERVFGMESAKWFTWEKCVSDVEDHFKRKEAVITRVKFDKKYYGCYKSAEVHTHKRKIPLKVFMPFILLAFIALLIFWFLSRWNDRLNPDPVPSAISSSVVQSSLLPSLSKGPGSLSTGLSLDQYIELQTPRIKDIPWSAPVYDKLLEPKTFPRPQCIRNNVSGVCKCYTQQATPLHISEQACHRYVEDGYFDHTRPDHEPAATAGEQGLPRPLAAIL